LKLATLLLATAASPIRAEPQELPQTPVVAAALLVTMLTHWYPETAIEPQDDNVALLKRGDNIFGVERLDNCRFQMGGPKGMRLDFGHLTREYSIKTTVRGGSTLTLTVLGDRKGSPLCDRGTCYPNLSIDGSSTGLRRATRAIQVIGEKCPLQELPF
jgi:hypothetical protein